ncbi:hypothetical protein SDC9_106774 [bioreactor metagenome]|uniref:Uncharacterized protein n=1 Tax=bioreactor metagenome TaxID=1076179 RepID=A0A645B4F6_9ZZZZ
MSWVKPEPASGRTNWGRKAKKKSAVLGFNTSAGIASKKARHAPIGATLGSVGSWGFAMMARTPK